MNKFETDAYFFSSFCKPATRKRIAPANISESTTSSAHTEWKSVAGVSRNARHIITDVQANDANKYFNLVFDMVNCFRKQIYGIITGNKNEKPSCERGVPPGGGQYPMIEI